MMYKLVELDKDRYDEYVKNHKCKSHFLQSSAWGKFASLKKGLKPYYLGLVDEDNNIYGASLLLEKKMPLDKCYLYAPRGFVLDYKDKELVNNFTKEVVKFAKTKKAIYIKIDPDLIKQSTNYLEETTVNPDYEELFNTLKECGFRHLGFTKNFETMQPRYTFRIDLTQDLKTIEDHFSKTTKQRISKALKLDTEVYIGGKEDVKEFYKLMDITENRKGFASYKEDYYETLYDVFNSSKNAKAILFMGRVNFPKTLKCLNERLDNLNNEIKRIDGPDIGKSAKSKIKELSKQRDNCLKEIEKYSDYQKQYGDSVILNGHMIIEYGDKAWVLYAGNHDILSETYANYHTYVKHIEYCKNEGLKIYDQFGTIGDLSKDNPRLGLHEFKKKFGGDYVEFIGEWDYVIDPIMYFAYNKLAPLLRKVKH